MWNAWLGQWICMCSKDVQKQLTPTSLINIIAPIWLQNMLGYLSFSQFSPSFTWKTVCFSEQIMSIHKYPSMFLYQMKASVYITTKCHCKWTFFLLLGLRKILCNYQNSCMYYMLNHQIRCIILLPAVPKDNGDIIICLSSSNFISLVNFFTSAMLVGCWQRKFVPVSFISRFEN